MGQNWDLDANWSIAEDKAVSDGSVNGFIRTSTNLFENGKTYKVGITVSDMTTGRVTYPYDGSGLTYIYTNGDFSQIYTPDDTNICWIYGSNGFDGSITNISVIEITDDTNLPRINYEGFSYQDALGSELILNGGFDTDSDWTKGTGWSIANGKAIKTAGNSGFLSQNAGLVVGKNYKATFTISNVTNGSLNLMADFSTSVQSFTSDGDYIVYYQPNGANLVFLSNATFNGSIDNVSVKEYLGQSVVPDSGCGSWLWEPQSTNLITYSEDFSQWGYSGDITVESGYLAPDGTNNAYKISGTTSALTLGGASETSTRTIYARTISGTGQANLCSFNQNTNNFFTVTEQWQRFEVNGAIATGGTTFYAVDFRGNTNLTDILIWGAQSEALSYATSYIPTNGELNGVTRNQDLCTNGGSLASINSTEGTLYFEGSTLSENTGTFRTIALSDGTTSNRVLVSYTDAANTIRLLVFRNNALQVIMDRTINATDTNKIAVKYELNEVDFWINGIKVGTDINAYMPIGLNQLSFSRGDGDLNFFGKTKALQFGKRL